MRLNVPSAAADASIARARTCRRPGGGTIVAVRNGVARLVAPVAHRSWLAALLAAVVLGSAAVLVLAWNASTPEREPSGASDLREVELLDDLGGAGAAVQELVSAGLVELAELDADGASPPTGGPGAGPGAGPDGRGPGRTPPRPGGDGGSGGGSGGGGGGGGSGGGTTGGGTTGGGVGGGLPQGPIATDPIELPPTTTVTDPIQPIVGDGDGGGDAGDGTVGLPAVDPGAAVGGVTAGTVQELDAAGAVAGV